MGAVSLLGVSPVCEPIACEFNMPSGERISHNCAGVGMDQVCVAECAAGYSGEARSLECNADRALLGTHPTCMPTACPNRSESNVVVHCSGITFGGTCLAECAAGFDGTPEKQSCGTNKRDGTSC